RGVPLDRGRRKNLHRVEKKIVPFYRHTLCFAQVENLLQAETEGAHQLVTIDTQYLGFYRVQPNQSFRRNRSVRGDAKGNVENLVHHTRLNDLRSRGVYLKPFERSA